MSPRENLYSYSVVRFRTSLYGEAPDIPLAVIVLSPEQQKLAIMGMELDRPANLSEVGWEALENLREILKNQVDAAFEVHGLSVGVFDYIAEKNVWNLYITPVKPHKARISIEMAAFDLFLQEVADIVDRYQDHEPTDRLRERDLFLLGPDVIGRVQSSHGALEVA